MYKIVKRLSHNWRGLNGGPRLMQMVAAGAVFKDRRLSKKDQQGEVPNRLMESITRKAICTNS